MAQDHRPLSPHLQVYKLPFTAILSITHRITGVALGLGALGLVYWLAAAAAGPAWFEIASALAGSWFGRLVLLGFSWALFFHLLNGIRHLFWDAGFGYEMGCARLSGWIVLTGSLVLTAIAWGVGLAQVGATP